MSTLEEKKKLIAKLNERIAVLKSKLQLLVIIPLIGLSIASCNKDSEPQPDNLPQQELITQSFNMMSLNKDRIAKGFDLSQWVYAYSPVQYELKLTSADGKNSYVKQVSIQELMEGNVSIKMFAGVYNVTYTPTHTQKYDNVLDISIDMQNLNINGSPVTLQGKTEDALIIIDRPDIFPVVDEIGQPCFYQDSRGFWYAYVNSGFSIKAIIQATGVQIPISLATVNTGFVYWFAPSLDGTIKLEIPEMQVQRLTL